MLKRLYSNIKNITLVNIAKKLNISKRFTRCGRNNDYNVEKGSSGYVRYVDSFE